MHNDRWLALHSGKPTQPNTAFTYIKNSFRQTTPFIVGALRLLANSFTPQEINERGWGLYTQFRPTSEGWGHRSEVRCATILALRQAPSVADEGHNGAENSGEQKATDVVKFEPVPDGEDDAGEGRESKRAKGGMTLEEYEATLDEDHTFDDVSLDI